jgi:hypothetical protein
MFTDVSEGRIASILGTKSKLNKKPAKSRQQAERKGGGKPGSDGGQEGREKEPLGADPPFLYDFLLTYLYLGLEIVE